MLIAHTWMSHTRCTQLDLLPLLFLATPLSQLRHFFFFFGRPGVRALLTVACARTDDPRDPYFYSTCYLVKQKVLFDDLPPPATTRAINWHAAGKCLSCNATAANAFLSAIPSWKLGTLVLVEKSGL